MNKIEYYEYFPEYAKNIRQKVFVEEQKFQNEFDDIDDTCTHLLLFHDDKAVATARMFTKDNGKSYFLGRIAVLKEYRGKHLGSLIVNSMCETAKKLGATKCTLSAQCRVKEFYNSVGFVEQGEEYLDEYCPHILMEKEL